MRPLPAAAATAALVGAAFGFAAIPIFTSLATNAGTPLVTVLAGRYVVGALVLAAMVRTTVVRLPRARLWWLLGPGGAAQALLAFLSLSALEYIPAATLVFLFYTFPAWVAVIAIVRRSERLTGRLLTSLALSLSGVAAMVGLPGADAVHPAGAALALSAALVYALYIPFINHLQTGVSPAAATVWIAVGAALVFVVGGMLTDRLTIDLPSISWFAVAGLGLVSTVMAFVLFLRGLAAVGPVRTAIVSTAEPFFVAVLAALVLDQPIRPATAIGGLLIALAVLLLQSSSMRQASGAHG